MNRNRNAMSASWQRHVVFELEDEKDESDLKTLGFHAELNAMERVEEEEIIYAEKEHIKMEIHAKLIESQKQYGSTMEAVEYTGPCMYIYTVSSLLYDPFKVKIESGHYTVKRHRDGYVFTKNGTIPDLDDTVKILNERDGDPGFYGTYWSGGTDNHDILKMVFNHFLPNFKGIIRENFMSVFRVRWGYSGEYRDDDYYCSDEYDDDDYDTDENDNDENEGDYVPLKKIDDYNNIPVLFYLNTQLKLEDLKDLHLSEHHNFGNGFLVWKVSHPSYGELGVAVQQPHFINMMGDQMGLALFADMKCARKLENFAAYGFGNIEYDWREIKNEAVTDSQFTSDYFKALINVE